MGDGSTVGPAPEGGTDALQKRIKELEAVLLSLRRCPHDGNGVVDNAALRPSDPPWRVLATALPQFVWVAPSIGAAEFINDYWFRYTGVEPGALHLEGWRSVVHPDDWAGIAALWDRALAAGAGDSFEFRVRRASDGLWRWHLGFHEPVLDPSGAIVNWVGVAFDIHDRKLTEEALRASEERQRLAGTAGSVGLWDWDIPNDTVVWSEPVYEFHGLAPGSFPGTGRDFLKLVHPEDATGVAEAITAAIDQGQAYDIEFRAVRPDGGVRWLSTKAQVIKDAQDRAVRMLGAVVDVTTARAAQQDLNAANQALQSLIDHAPDGLFVADRSGRCLTGNPAACELLGYTKAELAGVSIADLVRPEERERLTRYLVELAAGKIEVSEWEFQSKGGEWIPVALSVKLLPDGRIQAFIRDVRESRRLQSAALHLAAIVESSDDAIISKDLNGVIKTWNHSAERVFGYTAREVVGQHISILIPPDRLAEEPEILRRLQRGERVDHFETIRRRKDGALLNISLTISPVRDVTGKIIGASKIARDITAQKEAEQARAAIALDNARLFEQSQRAQEELKRSNRDLLRANQDLETFAYSASHDLQEPLRMISISAQLLERQAPDLDANSRNFVNGIKEGAGRMQTLIEDLLSYTRATRQGEGPVPLMDSGVVLEGVLQNLKPLLEQDGARVEIGSPLPQVAIHEVHLTQLFQNLIGNALKYRSAEAPYVHISAVEQEGFHVFSVSDNGLGIDARFSDQIFGLFKRLHTRDEYPGSGIGLAICKRIVEQYGGRIWLERSAPGDGSVFSFCFPAQQPPR